MNSLHDIEQDRALALVIREVSQFTGTDFLNELTTRLAELLGAQYVYIARLTDDLHSAEVIAGWERGARARHFVYSLKDTPCDSLTVDGVCVFNGDIQALFPADIVLAEMDVDAYMGVVLTSNRGEKIGLLNVLFERQILEPDWALSLLELFAVRLSAELERLQHQAELNERVELLQRQNNELLLAEHIYASAREAIVITDANAVVQKVNKAFEAIFAQPAERVIGSAIPLAHLSEIPVTEEQIIPNLGVRSFESWVIAIKDPASDRVQHYVRFSRDVTDSVHSQRLLDFQSKYDESTRLLNRTHFIREVNAKLEALKVSGDIGVFVVLDIDNFKSVNHVFGQDIGDRVIRRFASAARSIMGRGAMAARVGADEFALFITGPDTRNWRSTLDAFRTYLKGGINVAGYTSSITISSGASIFPTDASDVQGLINAATMALSQAKQNGRNTHANFTPAIRKRTERFQQIYNQLSKDGGLSKIYAVYQPIVSLKSGAIVACEALARWDDPLLGHVSPVEFVDVCERTGLVRDLGDVMFHHACAFLAKVRKNTNADLTVSINRSPPEVLDQVDAPQRWANYLSGYGLTPQDMQIEITESLMLSDPEAALRKLSVLSDVGFSLSIDDFGTGYSSLAYINRYPFSVLKIDRSFVADIETDESAMLLVESIINIAKRFALTTVAEGVETQGQMQILRDLGCDRAQGYFFHKPMQEAALFELLTAQP
ncbi:putative bifunctional diguanylate cyclase/phosphodiesterase [Neptunomonas marina]|uniref:GGDEF and EAL domain-containing protein n=1 Tax=Neptunomonas marina TaxID=1815562 RepID=A0A437QCP8_9GAMM|nr:EAL domain-containing protein [Neptunomonas marina]RVU32296.1 GGDEF and EAL domain-containing protein [Neptunomonas marina]